MINEIKIALFAFEFLPIEWFLCMHFYFEQKKRITSVYISVKMQFVCILHIDVHTEGDDTFKVAFKLPLKLGS